MRKQHPLTDEIVDLVGSCIGQGIGGPHRELSELLYEHDRKVRSEAINEAADNLLFATHEKAHKETIDTQYMSDRTPAHVTLDVATEWLRSVAKVEEKR